MIAKVLRWCRDSYWFLGTASILWVLWYGVSVFRTIALLGMTGGFPNHDVYPYDRGWNMFDVWIMNVWRTCVPMVLLLFLSYTAYYHFKKDHYGKWLVHNMFSILIMYSYFGGLIILYFLDFTPINAPEFVAFMEWVQNHVPAWLL